MKRAFTLVPLFLAVPLFVGCGSSSKSTSTPDVTGAEIAVAAGLQALADGDVAGANAQFRTAVAKDPSNPRGNIGAAVTEVALVESDPDVNRILGDLGITGVPPIPSPLGAFGPRERSIGRFSLVPRHDYDPMRIGRSVFGLLLRATANPPAVSEIQDVIKTRIMSRLSYAESRLNVVEQNPNFVWKIPPAVTGEPDSVEVDLGDVLLVDAVINLVQGPLGLVVAYNFDADYENLDAEMLLAPGSPWATLHPDGAAQLSEAYTSLLTADTRIHAAEQSIQGETDEQSDDLVPQSVDLSEIIAGLDEMANALEHQITVSVRDYQGGNLDVELSAGVFFTSPIQDWKPKLPFHTFDPTTHDPIITDPLGFPDPRFNGLFPTMTNALWQQIVGPISP
ncbi:MAG: hypothetical protein A2W00_01430 [Candidatus Eisenbacteria bacterium RBG_16_71_46]|nr:MAG: hypothetical protein A2W00_01430 [Candidatus Eisenbacteria bacterium RBG_16_71_46]OGF23917.1 MAG: hypothetical protein A2V63_04635 [Candidatus Eisenbacteria bacterium RBG_19FT_COMBO_70_11]